MALGPSVYKLIFDTQGLDTLVATRREMSVAKQIMQESIGPADKYALAWDQLNQLLNKELVTVEEYNKQLVAIRSELPENASALESLNAVFTEAESVRRSLMTADDELAESERQYQAALEGSEQLLQAGIHTQEQYADTQAKLAASSPAVLEAEREAAALRRDAAGILDSLVTDEQRFAETRARAFEALRAGLITERDYQAVLARSPAALQAVADAERQVAEAERQREAALRNMIAMNDRFMPAGQRARQELVQLRAAYAAGHVGIDSYRNGVIQLTATQLSGIPVIGRIASQVASLGVVGAVGAAGIGLVTTAVFKMKQQFEEMDKLLQLSDNIGIAADQLQRMQFAAELSDINSGQFASGIEKMMVGISKASEDAESKSGKVFTRARLDADALKQVKPEEAFLRITEAIGMIPNSADRARAATEIFGSADWVRMDPRNIERATDLFRKMGVEITESGTEKFREMSDAVKIMNKSYDLAWQKLSQEYTPAVTRAAEVMTDLIITLKQAQDEMRSWKKTVDETFPFLKDMPDLMQPSDRFKDAMRKQFGAFPEPGKKETKEPVNTSTTLIDDDLKERNELLEEVAKAEQKRRDAVAGVISQLEDEYAKLTKSTEAYAARKVALAGGGPLEMIYAMALAQQTDALKKQQEAEKKAAEEKKRKADELRDFNLSLDDEIRKLEMTERMYFATTGSLREATDAERAAALAKYDQIKALEAEKLGMDAIKDLNKQIRQFDMTAGEKKIDDLREAGVSEEQLKVAEGLQKELELRERIKNAILQTSAAVKAGSREAADAIAKAMQVAVLQDTKDRMFGRGGAGRAGRESDLDLLGSMPATVTATAIPPEPVITSPRYLTDAEDRALWGEPEPLVTTTPFSIGSGIGATTAFSLGPTGEIVNETTNRRQPSPTATAAQPQGENVKVQQEIKSILIQIRDKTKPPEVQEVTL